MDANSLTAVRFKAQVNKFSGILSRSLAKTKKRFFKEVLYGLQAGKDIKLSNISRALMESIPLIKTENRLSRNLDDADFSEHLNSEILRLGHRHITPDMVIAIDPGDICKPYAKAMENLCAVYDGTKKEPKVLPTTVPTLLLNGTLGIAVGMATNIPPHNLIEVMDAVAYLVDNKEATTEDLLQFIKGPDFPLFHTRISPGAAEQVLL